MIAAQRDRSSLIAPEWDVYFSHLPGGDLVTKGLEDLARSDETVEALLVSIGLECSNTGKTP